MTSKASRRLLGPDLLTSAILVVLIVGLSPATKAASCGCSKDIKPKLAQPVRDYDNQGAPLIPTLLGIAETYNLAMGIERVTEDALMRPAAIKLQSGSLSQLLDLCVTRVPGYSWALDEDVVHVFGAKELTQTSNLFSLVVPSFEIREQTLNAADSKLRMTVTMLKNRPTGIVGSHLGRTEFEDARFTFAARSATVREILNSLVSLHGKSVWIARVPPERLSQLPRAGLWRILPHSVHDPKGLLEPLPAKGVGREKLP